MEVRLRSNVSRTSKGYSCEATLEISGDPNMRLYNPSGGGVSSIPSPLIEPERFKEWVDALSAFQIAKLREHLTALEAAFPATLETK